MPSLSELLAQKAELEKQIIETQREERATAIAQIRSLMAQYGLSAADLNAKAPAVAPRRGNTGKVPAKYRDPQSGNTWSGRGLQPKWLKAALADGRSLSDFAL